MQNLYQIFNLHRNTNVRFEVSIQDMITVIEKRKAFYRMFYRLYPNPSTEIIGGVYIDSRNNEGIKEHIFFDFLIPPKKKYSGYIGGSGHTKITIKTLLNMLESYCDR